MYNEKGMSTILMTLVATVVAVLLFLGVSQDYLKSLVVFQKAKMAFLSNEITEQMAILIRSGVDTWDVTGGACRPPKSNPASNSKPFCVPRSPSGCVVHPFNSSANICLDNSLSADVITVLNEVEVDKSKYYVDQKNIFWEKIMEIYGSLERVIGRKAWATAPDKYLLDLADNTVQLQLPKNQFSIPPLATCDSVNCVRCSDSDVQCYRIAICLKQSCGNVNSSASDWLHQTIGILK